MRLFFQNKTGINAASSIFAYLVRDIRNIHKPKYRSQVIHFHNFCYKLNIALPSLKWFIVYKKVVVNSQSWLIFLFSSIRYGTSSWKNTVASVLFAKIITFNAIQKVKVNGSVCGVCNSTREKRKRFAEQIDAVNEYIEKKIWRL